MTSALALAAALAGPVQTQTSPLTVGSVRQTYGELGPTRIDTKYLPRDFVFVSFDIEGLKATPEGKVTYSMSMEVLDKVGKAIFTAPPAKQEMLLPLGAVKLPAFVYITLGPDMKPAPYTAKVTIVDENGKTNKTFEQKFELLPPNFGLVALYVTKDDKGMLATGPVGVVGQTVFVNFGMVGFGRNASGKPNAAVEFRVLDDKGRPLNAQPIVVPVPTEFPATEQFVPFRPDPQRGARPVLAQPRRPRLQRPRLGDRPAGGRRRRGVRARERGHHVVGRAGDGDVREGRGGAPPAVQARGRGRGAGHREPG